MVTALMPEGSTSIPLLVDFTAADIVLAALILAVATDSALAGIRVLMALAVVTGSAAAADSAAAPETCPDAISRVPCLLDGFRALPAGVRTRAGRVVHHASAAGHPVPRTNPTGHLAGEVLRHRGGNGNRLETADLLPSEAEAGSQDRSPITSGTPLELLEVSPGDEADGILGGAGT
jgi:hypothetical protein